MSDKGRVRLAFHFKIGGDGLSGMHKYHMKTSDGKPFVGTKMFLIQMVPLSLEFPLPSYKHKSDKTPAESEPVPASSDSPHSGQFFNLAGFLKGCVWTPFSATCIPLPTKEGPFLN